MPKDTQLRWQLLFRPGRGKHALLLIICLRVPHTKGQTNAREKEQTQNDYTTSPHPPLQEEVRDFFFFFCFGVEESSQTKAKKIRKSEMKIQYQ